MHLYQRVIRSCRPGKRSAAGQSRRVSRLCRMAADALSGLRYLAPGSAPSQARQAQRRRATYPAPCRVCAGWRLTPYPAYVIWRRVRPLSRPGKRSAAGQSRRVPRLCRMAADALSGLRYLAPGSAPSQARQAQRRRAIGLGRLCREPRDVTPNITPAASSRRHPARAA